MRCFDLSTIWWVRSDACGLFSAFFTIVLVLYAQYVVVVVVLLPWYGMCGHVIVYSCCSLLSIISHCRAQFTDPGCVPLQATPEEEPQHIQCKWCQSAKPRAALHCSTCERCVVRMDHHCPWVNNCVAMLNQKYFVLFLVYTALCCIYSGVLLVARFVSCTRNIRTCHMTTLHGALAVANFVEALVFGLFVIIMFYDQISAIFDNAAPGMGPPGSKGRGKYDALKDVFGEPASWRWLLPLSMPPRIMEDFKNEVGDLAVLKKPPPGVVARGPDGLVLRRDQNDETPRTEMEQ